MQTTILSCMWHHSYFFVIDKDHEMGKAFTEFTSIKITKHRQYYQYSREQGQNLKLYSQIGNVVRKNKLKFNRDKCTLGKKTQTRESYIEEQLVHTNSFKKDRERDDLTIKAENESAPILLQEGIMSCVT